MDIRLQPGAKKNESAGLMQNRLRLRLTAPPVDNKANKALVLFVAQKLGLRPRKIDLVAGTSSRLKTLAISSEKEPDWSVFK